MQSKNDLYQIGEVARLFHLSISLLRHYDKTGLVYDGRYHSSLSLGGVEGNNDSLIRSTNQFSITVEWKQNEG